MLQAIRSKTASIVVKALAGLLIISFAAWGVEDFIASRASDLPVASVGEVEIDPLEYEYELDTETRQVRRLLGGSLTDEQLLALGIGNSVLQRMINESAMSVETTQLGLRVSDEQVARSIHSDPSFNGFDGNFSRDRFYEVLRSLGLPEQVYVERLRHQMAREQVINAVTASPTAPSKLTEILRNYRYEARTGETLLVRSADQAEPPAPTETDLQTFHKDQASRFTAPEYRKITFAYLDPEQLMAGLEISQEELQQAYEANLGQFVKPELRTVQQMVLTDEGKAAEASRQLAEGKDFLVVAKEVAEMEEAAVDLGTVGYEGLLPELADAAFAVEEGAATNAIKSPLGYHIMRVTAIRAGEEQTLDEVTDQVREIAGREKAIDALYDLSARFEDEIGGGATVEEAGKTVGFDAVTIDAVDRQGMDPAGVAVAGLPDVASLLPVAFSAEQGIESPLTEAGDKGFFMVRVDDVIAPALRPLESVRDDVAAAWRDAEQAKLAEKRASDIASKISAGTPLSSFEAETGTSVTAVGPVTRSTNQGVDPTVRARMFELSLGGAGIAKVGDGYQVIKLAPSASSATGDDVPTQAGFTDQLNAEIGQDLTAQLLEAVRNTYGVSINQNILEAVLEPGPYDPYHGQRQQHQY